MTSSICSTSSIVTAKSPALLTSLAAKTHAANAARVAKAQPEKIAKAATATAAAEKTPQAPAAAAKVAPAQIAIAVKAAAVEVKVPQIQAAVTTKALAAQSIKDAKVGKTVAAPNTPDLGLSNQNTSTEKSTSTPASDANQFVAGDGDVVVDIKNSDSGYNNKIYWSSDNFKTRNYLGIDNQTGTYNIGKFATGTKIDFGIDNGVGQFFKTGAAANNVDNLVHAKVTKTTAGTVIGFEDLYGGGDNDFNDAIIGVKNIPAPNAPRVEPKVEKPKVETPKVETKNTSTNRSGLGDGTNPGKGSGTNNATNVGTNNPNKAKAYLAQPLYGSLLSVEA